MHQDKARFLAVKASHAGDFLLVAPDSSLGIHLDSDCCPHFAEMGVSAAVHWQTNLGSIVSSALSQESLPDTKKSLTSNKASPQNENLKHSGPMAVRSTQIVTMLPWKDDKQKAWIWRNFLQNEGVSALQSFHPLRRGKWHCFCMISNWKQMQYQHVS